MLVDIDANATVYVQPTSRGGARCLHCVGIYDYRITCLREQHTVAVRRIAGLRSLRHCCSALVRVVGRSRIASDAQLDKSRDDRRSEMSSAVMRQYVSDFLL